MDRRSFVLATLALVGCRMNPLDFSGRSDFTVTGRTVQRGSAVAYPGHGNWQAVLDSGEVGVKLYGADRYEVSGAQLLNIAGTGVDVQASAGGWQHVGRIHGVMARDCYRGFWLHNGAEYETVSDCWADNCVFGFVVESGNNAFSNCKVRWCSIGVKIIGGPGLNDGHGVWTGLLATHCTYPLICQGVTLGEAFVGCSFIGGQAGADQAVVQMIGSKGISLVGGQVAYCDITVDAASQLALRGVTLRGPVNVTVAPGGVFDAKDSIVMPGAAITLNGAAWSGNTP